MSYLEIHLIFWWLSKIFLYIDAQGKYIFYPDVVILDNFSSMLQLVWKRNLLRAKMFIRYRYC